MSFYKTKKVIYSCYFKHIYLHNSINSYIYQLEKIKDERYEYLKSRCENEKDPIRRKYYKNVVWEYNLIWYFQIVVSIVFGTLIPQNKIPWNGFLYFYFNFLNYTLFSLGMTKIGGIVLWH